MGNVEFQETTNIDVLGAMTGDVVDKSDMEQGSTELGTQLHVYIVFEEGVSIEDGIKAIENTVLDGEELEVVRKDTTGNAVVAIVTSAQNNEIEQMQEVKTVKINEAVDTTVTTGESSQSDTTTKTGSNGSLNSNPNGTDQENAGNGETALSEADQSQSGNSSQEAQSNSGKASSKTIQSTEETSIVTGQATEETSTQEGQATEESSTIATTETEQGNSNNTEIYIAGSIILVLVAMVIAFVFRRR
jgi:hypothetical protein